MRKRLLLGLGAVFLALVVSVASAALGDHESSFDFDLASGNKQGITWDGTHFWVIYSQVDELRAYTSAGTAVPSLTFDLSGTPSPFGVTWDGTYLRVLDGSSVEGVDTYTTAGAYLSGPSFGLDASNDGPFGVTAFIVIGFKP